jgi:DNA-binding NarL/FixJ family response regulator
MALESAEACASHPPAEIAHEDPLTPREREVAALVARGLSNREIASLLVVSEGTAGNHVQHILEKLGFHTRAQIASWATACGVRYPSAPAKKM